jgi:phytol kinase
MTLLYIVLVLALLSGLLVLASIGIHRGRLKAETARKIVHAGMGGICLCFPLLFKSPEPVTLLASIAVVSLLVVRHTPLKTSIGSSLFSVERISIGDLLFPISVAWLFSLAEGKFTLYTIALLLLTLADTMGALAGSKYGKKIYHSFACKKSIEGSLAFLATAFVCITIPLYLSTNIPLTTVLTLAISVGLFATAVEGASGNGLDNLLIPIGSFLLLDNYITLSGAELVFRIGVLLLILAALLYTRKLHTLDGGAILTALIYTFAATTLGGPSCLVACLIVLTRHILVQKRMPQQIVVSHSLAIIVAIAIPTLLWLTLGVKGILPSDSAQFGFICTLAIIIAMLHAGTQKFLGNSSASLFKGVSLSVLVLFSSLPLLSSQEFWKFTILLTLTLTIPLSLSYYHWKGCRGDNDPTCWLKLCFLALLGTTPLLLLFL